MAPFPALNSQSSTCNEPPLALALVRRTVEAMRWPPGSRFAEIQLVFADHTVPVLPQGRMPESMPGRSSNFEAGEDLSWRLKFKRA